MPRGFCVMGKCYREQRFWRLLDPSAPAAGVFAPSAAPGNGNRRSWLAGRGRAPLLGSRQAAVTGGGAADARGRHGSAAGGAEPGTGTGTGRDPRLRDRAESGLLPLHLTLSSKGLYQKGRVLADGASA